MSDSSDVEIVEVTHMKPYDDKPSNDDFLNNSSDDSEDTQVFGKFTTKRAKNNEIEKDRRNNIATLINSLHDVIFDGHPVKPLNRQLILATAVKVCQELTKQGRKLSLESELLLQHNWRLKKQISRLSRSKKRKSACSVLTKGVSNLSLNTSKSGTTSFDEHKPKNENETDKTVSETKVKEAKEPSESSIETTAKIPRRRYKKKAGLTDEEKEFYFLKERIEDLLLEVDTLWNEVKDDEEVGENSEDVSCPSDNYIQKKWPNITFSNSCDNSSDNNGSSSYPTSASSMKNKPTKISVTDITKLMEPQFVKSQTNSNILSSKDVSSFKPCNSKTSDSSGDESPKLVIDEGNSDQEIDVIEALEAVDNLCRNLVDDDPITETENCSPNINVLNIKRNRANTALDDVIVIDE